MSKQLVSLLVSIVVVAAMALLANGVLMQLDDSTSGLETDKQQIVELNGDEYVTLADGAGTDETVVDSRGLAMKFDGTPGSYVESDTAINVASDNTWTVAQPVLNVANTSHTQTFLAVGDPNLLLQYVNNSSGTDQWSAVYITTTDSYRINVSAPNASSNGPAHVVVTRNQSNLTIWRNSTQGESVNVTTDNALSGDLTDDSNCNCTLDETRTFDDVLNSSQRQTLRDSPVAPLPGTNRTARLMYDEGSWTDTKVYVFWSGASATRGPNTSYVSGFEGQELTPDDALLESADYTWEKTGPKIKPENEWLQAPVFYVDYTFEGAASAIRQSWTGTMDLLGLAFQVLLFAFIGGVLLKFRSQT
jgi:hypothetical protein